MQKMKILTQNCWGMPRKNRRKRFDTIAKTIRERPYDLVCLQEVFLHRWYEQSFKEINNYHHSYKEGAISLKGGLLTLTRNVPQQTIFYPFEIQGNLFSQQITDAALGKGFLETIVEDNGEEITIINVHNVSIYRPRYKQKMYLSAHLEQLFEHVKKKTENGERLILAGDFNLERGSMSYYAFTKLLHDATSPLESQLDFLANSGETEKVQHLRRAFAKLLKDAAPSPGNQWDFVFANFGEVKKTKYVTHFGGYPSDHPGIYVDIELNR